MKTRRALLIVVPLAIIVALGFVLKQIGPQRAELGKFNSETKAQQAAFRKLSQILQQHPYTTSVEIGWRGPLWRPDYEKSVDRMRYSRKRETLSWQSRQLDYGGMPSGYGYSCEQVSATAIHNFVKDGAQEGGWPGSCAQGMLQLVDSY